MKRKIYDICYIKRFKYKNENDVCINNVSSTARNLLDFK